MKLKLKKEKIVVLTDEQQASINGGQAAELALTGSRLIHCGSRRVCSHSCKAIVCIPL